MKWDSPYEKNRGISYVFFRNAVCVFFSAVIVSGDRITPHLQAMKFGHLEGVPQPYP